MRQIKLEFAPKVFRWKINEAKSPFLPVVVDICGDLYQLSRFDESCENGCFHAGELSINDAFELSLTIHGEPIISELGLMIKLAESFEKHFFEIPVIASRVKGKKNSQSLKELTNAPKAFLDYIAIKTPSMKTIGIYASLPASHKAYLHKLVESEPSVSAFRTATEILTDYADRELDFQDEAFNTDALAKERKALKTDFEAEFRTYADKLGIELASPSVFETPELNISFSVSSPDEYIEKCIEINENKNHIYELFNFLRKNDIY